jgi:hypothetical protein
MDAAEELKAEPPDLSVLRLHRRPPPSLPLDVFGLGWRRWIADAASAAASPVDYVASALLPAASTMIGNARWAQAGPGWCEPPHLWCAAVGDSGGGKSPGADAIYRHVLPEMVARMSRDFPDRLQEYRVRAEMAKARLDAWEKDVRTALKKGSPPPARPDVTEETEPMAPRLTQNDVTIEKVAMLLAGAAPKGLLIARDELAGFLLGMNAYNEGARAFWIESYGGRPYSVDRIKHTQQILVPHLAVAWHGGIQPARLGQVMREADDGLLARFCWFWPDPVTFKLATAAPNIEFAIGAFDRLRMLEMAAPKAAGLAPSPVMTPLCEKALAHLERFAQDMQERQQAAGGLMVSALGKARGLALRLSLVLEFLWWAAKDGFAPPPMQIGEEALVAAVLLVDTYLMPMADRVYGDAAASVKIRNTATLARWIAKKRPAEVHVRTLQREVRLPDLTEAAAIHEACRALIEAGWLAEAPSDGGAIGRPRAVYEVRPELWKEMQ